jgi:hypothetical protein
MMATAARLIQQDLSWGEAQGRTGLVERAELDRGPVLGHFHVRHSSWIEVLLGDLPRCPTIHWTSANSRQ